MAATRIMALYHVKGKSVAQCLKDRIEYVMDEKKTGNEKYISSYGCNPDTCQEEFYLAKQEYEHITGRVRKNDVIAYQIRQSFKPGEVDPEEANAIGYELAIRITKGKHAFLVCTHTDKAHIHNHIIYIAVFLDCTRKFRDFHLLGLAVARLSDLICLEHSPSVIVRKPYSERVKRIVYPEKKYFRDEICEQIDAAL